MAKSKLRSSQIGYHNVPSRQFRKKTLADDFARILRETGVPANRLILEITENLLIDNIDEANDAIQCLSNLGIEISVDDFGTGYSGLAYLKRYPINVLKIDHSFVRDIATDSDDTAICHAIIALSHSLDKKVVAEGVETKQQLDFLVRQGCDNFQGFFFSKPLPAAEAKQWLQKKIDKKPTTCLTLQQQHK